RVDSFDSISKHSVARYIYSSSDEPIEYLMIAGYFAPTHMVEEDPELVHALVAAMNEPQHYAEDNPDEEKAILPEYSEIDPEIIDDLNMPKFPQEINMESTERIIELSVETGLIDESIDVSELVRDDS